MGGDDGGRVGRIEADVCGGLPVCCKPNVLTVVWDRSAREFRVAAELES